MLVLVICLSKAMEKLFCLRLETTETSFLSFLFYQNALLTHAFRRHRFYVKNLFVKIYLGIRQRFLYRVIPGLMLETEKGKPVDSSQTSRLKLIMRTLFFVLEILFLSQYFRCCQCFFIHFVKNNAQESLTVHRRSAGCCIMQASSEQYCVDFFFILRLHIGYIDPPL